MKNKRPICMILMIFSAFIFIGNANALRFTGDAWLAQHYEDGVATDEYYLVIGNPGVERASLRGFTFEPPALAVKRDFSELTSDENISWFDIDEEGSKYFRKLSRKAAKKSKKLVRKNKIKKEDQQAWEDEWISTRLEDGKFILKFWDIEGTKYQARINFAIFNNPIEPGNSNTTVPEPTTMVLLGSGLIGMAVLGRKRLLRSKK